MAVDNNRSWCPRLNDLQMLETRWSNSNYSSKAQVLKVIIRHRICMNISSTWDLIKISRLHVIVRNSRRLREFIQVSPHKMRKRILKSTRMIKLRSFTSSRKQVQKTEEMAKKIRTWLLSVIAYLSQGPQIPLSSAKLSNSSRVLLLIHRNVHYQEVLNKQLQVTIGASRMVSRGQRHLVLSHTARALVELLLNTTLTMLSLRVNLCRRRNKSFSISFNSAKLQNQQLQSANKKSVTLEAVLQTPLRAPKKQLLHLNRLLSSLIGK